MIQPWHSAIAMCLGAGWIGQPPVSSNPGSAAPQSASAEASTDAERFAKRLETVDAAMTKVGDLRADFVQRRTTPLLKKPLVSNGVVRTKGDRVRWDTVSPRASSLVVGHDSIRMYYPADQLVEIYPAGDGFKDIAGAPLPRLSSLKAKFDLTPLTLGDLGGANTDANLLAVLLTPKDESLRRHIASVRVLIDESQPAALRVEISDPDGEVTVIEFSHVEVNRGMKDDEVELTLPAGTRVSKPLGEGASGTQGDERGGAAAPETKARNP